ncbi:MAG: hypothetical protein IJ525_01690 [Alphaproteobacteria bacterium]|nr:hypothetical protein [Alphaproteobacteria bacterium]
MNNLKIKNIKSHPSQSLAKANASRDLQINFNQAEDDLTIPAESRHDYKCGFATQSGRSMIEMLGVLAIIGVLSVGGIAGYSKAMTKYRINKTIEQITLIAGNVRTFFAPQRNYKGLNSNETNGRKIIHKAKLVPDEMWNSDKTALENVFGGKVVLNANYKSFNSEDQAFDVTYDIGNNVEACIELLTHDWTNANVSFISVNNLQTIDKASFSLPISIDNAVNICSYAYVDPEDDVISTSVSLFFDADESFYKKEAADLGVTWY